MSTTAARCACPQGDARACYRFRNKIDLREMIDHFEVDDDGECSCGCHGDPLDDEGNDVEVCACSCGCTAQVDHFRDRCGMCSEACGPC